MVHIQGGGENMAGKENTVKVLLHHTQFETDMRFIYSAVCAKSSITGLPLIRPRCGSLH